MAKEHQSRAWRKVRAQVIAEEPLCWLRLPGCTTLSDTADHVITLAELRATGQLHRALDRANLRGACMHCNRKRNAKPVNALASTPSALRFFG